MTQLYLITGFLGAGKTTLLKGMVKLLSDRRLYIIVNEFGKEGVDGELLQSLPIQLEQINNGSIFCSCRLDKFEEALNTAVKSNPDAVLVEASGLSDPTNIEKVLQNFPEIDYMGSLCLVDALNFPKVLSTARVLKKQISVSGTILINKTDLVDEGDLENVEALIRSQYPEAVVHRTTYGQLRPEWLAAMKPAPEPSAPRFQTKDVGLVKKLIILRENMSLPQLEKFLAMFVEDTYRIKGFVRLDGAVYLVDCVGPRIAIHPWEETVKRTGCLDVLSGPGLPLKKSLEQAVAWYSSYIESIE